MAQTGFPSQTEMLASLRSGSAQRILHAIEAIKHDDLAGTLYQDLFHTAGSEPASSMEASAAAKALGFVLVIGLDENMETLSEEEFTIRIARLSQLLESVSPEVSGVAEEFQWRAVELMQYCTAYDFYRGITGAELPPAMARLARFADNAAEELDKPFVVRNNLSLKLAAAVGYAGIVLQNASVSGLRRTPRQWLETAMLHIDETMWEYQSDDDANYGYSEGPWYFRYAMISLLPFFSALDLHLDGTALQTDEGTIPNPLRDPRYHRLFEWIAALRMPDGHLPPFEDTYRNTFFPELAIVAGIMPQMDHLVWPSFDTDCNPVSHARVSAELARTFDARVEFLSSGVLQPRATSTLPLAHVMPEAGYAVFRNGWESDAGYVALIGKHGRARTHRSPVGSGHKHANETAFLMHAGGKLLALEPGYHSSSERDALIYGRQHNVILVDGKAADSTSFGSFLFGTDAHMEKQLTTGSSGMVSVRTQYQGADITRHAAVLDGRILILRDEVSSAFSHTYTHQVHGNGSTAAGTFDARFNAHQGVWTAGDMRLHAVVQATQGAVLHEAVTRMHAPSSRHFAEHTAMYSSVTGRNATFHSVLYPVPSAVHVESSTHIPCDGVTVTQLRTDEEQLFSLVNATGGSISTSTDALGTVETNAHGFFSIRNTAGRPVAWMLDGGSFIRSQGRMSLSSSYSLRALLRTDEPAWHFAARADRPATVTISVPFVVHSVRGSGIRAWTMQSGSLQLDLDVACDAVIEFTSVTTSRSTPRASPAAMRIDAPYPQPFAPGEGHTLIVPYELASPSVVQIGLYDMLGRRVYSLAAAERSAGKHAARLEGLRLSPGSYVLRIQNGHAQAQRSIVIH